MTGRRTPLYARNAERGAKFTDFGGWEMPVQFDSIQAEHRAVRGSVGLFDVSHMSEIELGGADAIELAQRLTTADVGELTVGQSQYTLLPDREGTIIDDAILYRLEEERYLLVANAGNDQDLTDHFETHRDEVGLSATVENRTDAWGMLAIQGPAAPSAIPAAVDAIERLGIERLSLAGVECWCARTGYTGEDGFEILVPWENTPAVEAAVEGDPCGLGARDTLRLEMGYVLAGNEFDRETNRRTPFEAGLGFAVDLDTDPPGLGREALVEAKEPGERLVGLVLTERGIPRSGYPVVSAAGDRIGEVTSGTMSPTLEQGIGLAYVASEYAEPGTAVDIEVRGAARKARIEDPPFVEAGR